MCLACILALVAGASLAPAAQAQDLPFTMTATDICLADKNKGSTAAGCIGTSAELCFAETSGSYAMAACFAYEHRQWDKRLNNVYGKLMAREKTKGRAQTLRDMQRAWIKSRDARCDYDVISEQWGGGTGTVPAINECNMQMTGEQTLVLQRMLQQ